MFVSDSRFFANPSPFTAITVSEDMPKNGWQSIIIDEAEYRPEIVLGSKQNLLLIEGKHDFIGKQIAFV